MVQQWLVVYQLRALVSLSAEYEVRKNTEGFVLRIGLNT